MPDNLTKATGRLAGRHLRGRAARLAVVALVGSAVALGSMGYLNRSTALTPSRASATETAPVSFADVADKVRPAVVAIQVTGTVDPAVESFDPRPFDEFFERFFGDDSERRFREFRERMPRRRAGVGSGFIVDADGFIVTNNHVIEDADEITVTLANGDSFEAELMGADPKTDLALVRIEADDALPYVRFGDSDETRVGDWVVAVGSPFGLDHSVTVGVVSAKDRSIGSGPYDSFLQIDAPINRGNSGGPAFNLDSEVIGVNSAIFSPSGGNIGIGFAIPANIAEDVVTQLRERGEVRRGWLGVSVQAVTEDIARSLDMDESTGAIVASVVPGSPADDAGIEAGDVIIAVGAADVASVRDLPRLVAMLEAGERAEIVVLRDGREKTLDAKIGTAPKSRRVAAASERAMDRDTVLGMRLAAIESRERQAFDLAGDATGVVIVDLAPDSAAAEKGLSRGDVIVSVDQAPVATPADVASLVEAAEDSERKAVLLLIARNTQERFVALPLRDA